jgi:mannitol 2-dehydrogenase
MPSYDRSALTHGIVHIGVGSFHRAHMGVYIDQLLHDPACSGWAICGVGLLPHDSAMGHALAAHDHLYTVLIRGQSGTSARVVGAMTDFLHAPSDPEAVLQKLADPATRIVSMTITESGYHVNEATGQLDIMHPDIQADLGRPRAPKTFYGYLATALERRRLAGHPPFTVMSCDNVEHNGALTRRMLLAFAHEMGGELGPWLQQHGAFPNSMVDRITPRTTDADRQDLAERFGIEDRWPVVTEPFSQWVIEDTFACGRPPLEAAGVQIVQNVAPYETMKLRLLNGSHSAMAYLGFLSGLTHVHEVLEDQHLARYIEQMMRQEVLPRLPEVPGIDLQAYCTTLLARFANPTIADQLARLCFDGSGKLPKFVLPSIEAGLAFGTPIGRLALCVAAWMRYLTGVDEAGRAFAVSDPMVGQLQPLARQGGADPSMLLAVPGLFSDELRQSEAFTHAVSDALKSLYERGAAETLAMYLE